MSDSSASNGSAKGYANLRPFKKGQSGNPSGSNTKKLRKLRKELLKMAPVAMEKLKALVEMGDIEGLKIWFKYALPVPTEANTLDVNVSTRLPSIRPELAAKLAALETQ